jgi:hypothetical protein
MAHREGLEAALTNLGMVLIESQAAMDENKKRPIILAAHRSRNGTVAGIFTEIEGLSPQILKQAKALHGYARQPLNSVLHSSGAGLFVADSILEAMSAHLRVARHHKLSGLAATFLPSQQLSIV